MPSNHKLNSPQKVKASAELTKRQAETARSRIAVGKIITKLNQCVEGKLTLKSEQIRAAQILLDRTMPTLQSIETTNSNDTDLASFLAQASEIASQVQAIKDAQDQLPKARQASKSPRTEPVKPNKTPSQPHSSVNKLN